MIRFLKIIRMPVWVFIFLVYISIVDVYPCYIISSELYRGNVSVRSIISGNTDYESEIAKLNEDLKNSLISGDLGTSRLLVDQIIKKTVNLDIDDSVLADSYYYIGVFYSFTRNIEKAISNLKISAELKEKKHEFDNQYARTLYNLGTLYGRVGDFNQHENYSINSLEIEKKVMGESSPELISTYSSLITAYIELQEYQKAVYYSNTALTIANKNPGLVDPLTLASLYNNLGACFYRLADFSKAKIYLDKSESIYNINHVTPDMNFINLMNNMAITYGALGLSGKSEEYYEKGISIASAYNSPVAYNMINSYAIILGNTDKKLIGKELLSEAAQKAKIRYGEDSRDYIITLNNYAEYLRDYDIDNKKSLEYYELCMDYLTRNSRDISLKMDVFTGYSLSLARKGEYWKALETIQPLLFQDNGSQQPFSLLDNPDIQKLKSDKIFLDVLKAKYDILLNIYRNQSDNKSLESASETAELIVGLIEKIRINISEEESRLILGDRYRDSYLNAIRDFNILYRNTRDTQYLTKAFQYSEKSKVAGLLTATRELKATQFHVPVEIADYEENIKRDISLFNARIAEETASIEPDTSLISSWKENLLEATRQRDSLVLIFEKQYPEYFALKYNTSTVSMNDIPKIIGRDGNYINYIVTDTLLYIFIVNRKYNQLISVPVDTTFNYKINHFRNLLTSLPSGNAKKAFQEYQSTGTYLYKILIEPVKDYIIDDKLVISPDNILSFLPFEAIPKSYVSSENIFYRNLDYLMYDYDISYTYSATFMAESVKRRYSLANSVISFAPRYEEPIDIQSVLMNRQAGTGVLKDLPFARQEAEYVSDITNGKCFLNDEAKESLFKKEAGKFDIVHLAMHTLLNDKNPMYSTLIFSNKNDSIDDGFLKTYEVYGIRLQAKMIVLSSCNTGAGRLLSGEGILSLARGFIFSGSQSVVMSLWEVEDKAGVDIIKDFYNYLKRGYRKSASLRKARISYLKRADQLRSHPYFWATLIVYGDNSPLYVSSYLIFYGAILILSVVIISIFYSLRRKYS